MPSLAISSSGACWVQFSPFINILCGTLVVSKPACHATGAAVAGCCSSTPLLQYQRQCLAATVTLPAVTRCTKRSLTIATMSLCADSLTGFLSPLLDHFPCDWIRSRRFSNSCLTAERIRLLLYMPCTVWPRTYLAFDFLIISEFSWEEINLDGST